MSKTETAQKAYDEAGIPAQKMCDETIAAAFKGLQDEQDPS